jgi:hypothetical protein
MYCGDGELYDMGVGFRKVCSRAINDSLGMSGRTLLSTNLLDAMTCGLH